jgi:hypothetical protein
MILPEHGPQLTLTGGVQYFAAWNYVHLGPEGDGLTAPEEGAEYGPPWTEVWTEKK